MKPQTQKSQSILFHFREIALSVFLGTFFLLFLILFCLLLLGVCVYYSICFIYVVFTYCTTAIPATFRKVSCLQGDCTTATLEGSTAVLPQSEQVYEELKTKAAEMIRTLRKTSAGLPIEDVFLVGLSTDPEIQLFLKILNILKSVCPYSDVDNLSSKFLHVIKQCQQKQVFRTLLIVFWIKFEGIVKASQSRLRKLTRVQSQRPDALEILLESEQDEFTHRQEQIFAQFVELLDKQFEKSFNPGNQLFTYERVCCAKGLYIITEIQEIYFLYFYRKSAKLRKLHHVFEPCMDRCSYFTCCSHVVPHVLPQSEQVYEELKTKAAEMIRTLRKTSAGLRIEDVFSVGLSTDPEIQLFLKILNILKSVCPYSDVDNFSSKFLHVIKQCQQKQVFRTLLIVFWIKFEGIVKASQSRLRKLTRVQSQRPDALEILLESEQDEFPHRQEQIFPQFVELLDKQFEKSFNPGNQLFTYERVCCAKGLYIITEIQEIYFLYFYRKSAKLRKLHHVFEPCMDRCSYFTCCSFLLSATVVGAFITAIIFCIVNGTVPFQQ